MIITYNSISSIILQFLDEVRTSQHSLGTTEHLATFIVEALYHALVCSTRQLDTSSFSLEEIATWFKTYRYNNM